MLPPPETDTGLGDGDQVLVVSGRVPVPGLRPSEPVQLSSRLEENPGLGDQDVGGHQGSLGIGRSRVVAVSGYRVPIARGVDAALGGVADL